MKKGQLAPLKPVLPPTQTQIDNIIPELTDRWARTTLMALERAEQAIKEGNGLQAKYWGTFGGIGTDKIMPLKGMPTHVVSNIHLHRVDLGPLLDRMAISARVVERHYKKGYLAPVTHPYLDLAKDDGYADDAVLAPSDTVHDDQAAR